MRRGLGRKRRATYLRLKHPHNLCALIAHNPVRLLVIQHGNSVSPIKVLLRLKVHIPQVRKLLMPRNRIRHHILPRLLLVRSRKTPSLVAEVPVYSRVGDDVLETLETAKYESSVRLQ